MGLGILEIIILGSVLLVGLAVVIAAIGFVFWLKQRGKSVDLSRLPCPSCNHDCSIDAPICPACAHKLR